LPDHYDLKKWLHQKVTLTDKLLLILAATSKPLKLSEVREQAKQAGLRIPKSTNISTLLSRSKGKAIRTPQGWEITELGKDHLTGIGITPDKKSKVIQSAIDLRFELANVKDKHKRSFMEEAIKCCEAELYRSAIVMSWIAAVDILYEYVVDKKLSEFNAEAKRVYPKWVTALTVDDLGKMKEADFLERIAAISVIGKNTKKELKDCLDRRNGCGHPNSLKIGQNTAAHHIEILILNVFQPFS